MFLPFSLETWTIFTCLFLSTDQITSLHPLFNLLTFRPNTAHNTPAVTKNASIPIVTPNPAAAAAAPLSPADDFDGFTHTRDADAVLLTVSSPGSAVIVLPGVAEIDVIVAVGGDVGTIVSPLLSVLLSLWRVISDDDDDISKAEERGAFVVLGAEIVSEEERGGVVLVTSGDGGGGGGSMEITMGVIPPVFVDGDCMIVPWWWWWCCCRVDVVEWMYTKDGWERRSQFSFINEAREVFVCCLFASHAGLVVWACVGTQVVVWRWVGCGGCLFADYEHGRCLVYFRLETAYGSLFCQTEE